MTLEQMTFAGTITWSLLILVQTIRGCRAGHAPSALLNSLILMVINVEIWALVPPRLVQALPAPAAAWTLLSLAALAPLIALKFLKGKAASSQ